MENLLITRLIKNECMEDVIKLIFDTDPYIYDSMCDGDFELFKNIMEQFLKLDEHVFSRNNIIVARTDNEVNGLLLFFSKDANCDTFPIDLTEKQFMILNYVCIEYFWPLIVELEERADEWIYINNLCVAAHKRRQGLASGLLAVFLKHILPGTTIITDCLETNRAAIELFQKAGFKKTRTFDGFAGSGKKIKVIRLEKTV
jgi:ribosomal protein S18 acetylase RimI-like enzyme